MPDASSPQFPTDFPKIFFQRIYYLSLNYKFVSHSGDETQNIHLVLSVSALDQPFHYRQIRLSLPFVILLLFSQ